MITLVSRKFLAMRNIMIYSVFLFFLIKKPKTTKNDKSNRHYQEICTNLCSSDSCVSHLFPFFVSRSRKSDQVSQVSSHGCRRDFSTEYLLRLLTQKNKHYYVHCAYNRYHIISCMYNVQGLRTRYLQKKTLIRPSKMHF